MEGQLGIEKVCIQAITYTYKSILCLVEDKYIYILVYVYLAFMAHIHID